MPKGVFIRSPKTLKKLGKYIRTPEILAKMSKSMKQSWDMKIKEKGRLTKYNTPQLAIHSQRMLGRHLSKETKLKISLSHKNSVKVKEHLRILHENSVGKQGWTKGLTKATDNRISWSGRPKGFHHTEATKLKLSLARKGKKASIKTKLKMSMARKGKSSWQNGLTKETDERVARMAKGRSGIKRTTPVWNTGLTKKTHPSLAKRALHLSETSIGENNPNWKGGLSFYPYTPDFNKKLKDRIRKRDNYTCQYPNCGIVQNGISHDIHHIDYNKENIKDNNLITLCHCHNTTVNSNRKYWTKYFNNLLLNKSYDSTPIDI